MNRTFYLAVLLVVVVVTVSSVDGGKYPTPPKHGKFRRVANQLWRACLNGTLMTHETFLNLCKLTLSLSKTTRPLVDQIGPHSVVRPNNGNLAVHSLASSLARSTGTRNMVRASKASKLAKAQRKAAKAAAAASSTTTTPTTPTLTPIFPGGRIGR